MLFMKDMRAKVVAECTLKESAAINQILGRKVRLATTVSMLTIYAVTGWPTNYFNRLSMLIV